MNVLLKSGCFTAQVTPAMATRLFHGSAARLALPKKKLKPKPPVNFINGLPQWVHKRNEMDKQKEELAAQFKVLAEQKVIHMPKPKLQSWVTDLSQQPVDIVDLNPQVGMFAGECGCACVCVRVGVK